MHLEEMVDILNLLAKHIHNLDAFSTVWRNDVNQFMRETDNYGNTPLHWLLYRRKINENFLKELLDCGAPVNAVNNYGKTPLCFYLQSKHCELPIVKLLVNRGIDVKKSDYAMFALWNDNCSSDVIEFLCDKGADIKVVDGLGCSLLHHASTNRQLPLDVVKMLLDKGASAHVVNMLGETPLHVAVINNRKDVVELLLKLPKIKVNLFNKQRLTPLHLAVSDPKIDPGILKLLLEAGAIVDKKTKQDRQCLHLAAQHCNPAHIKILLDYGARVDVYDKDKMSPLYIAVNKSQHYDRAALKLLLDAGVLIFHEKHKKKLNPWKKCPLNASTALHEAVRVLNIEKRSKRPHQTRQVLLLLKYALIEKPRMCFQNMQADIKTKHMLIAYNQKCMEELKTVCIAPKVTLAQFILRSSLQEDGECLTNDILEILSARPYPLYREVVAGLMDRDDLKDGLQRHPVYALNEKKPDECAVLDYDTLCGVMIYLTDDDLLNLLFAVFEPKRSPVPQVKKTRLWHV